MSSGKRVEAHNIVSKHIFPYLVLGRAHTVNHNTIERLFNSRYGSEWSYTNVLIRFPYNLGGVARYTILVYVSFCIRPVEMGQYPVVGFVSCIYSAFRFSCICISSFCHCISFNLIFSCIPIPPIFTTSTSKVQSPKHLHPKDPHLPNVYQ